MIQTQIIYVISFERIFPMTRFCSVHCKQKNVNLESGKKKKEENNHTENRDECE